MVKASDLNHSLNAWYLMNNVLVGSNPAVGEFFAQDEGTNTFFLWMEIYQMGCRQCHLYGYGYNRSILTICLLYTYTEENDLIEDNTIIQLSNLDMN